MCDCSSTEALAQVGKPGDDEFYFERFVFVTWVARSRGP
jgi:hypothetical protein